MFTPMLLAAVCTSGIYLLWSYYTGLLGTRFRQKHNAVADVPFLGMARECKIRGAAVVCGGSIAGLVAARVCHDHFERVIIVEPEAWLATPEGWRPEREPNKVARARVMQYQAAHVFLAFGFMALEALFPSLREECRKAGIRVGPADFKFAIGGHLINLGDDKSQNALPQTLFASRHGLETLLRRLVVGNKNYPNIEQMVGTVTGVISSATDPTKVQGVSVRTSSGEQVISASLVVDCSGAAQAGLKWLQRAGFGTADLYCDGSDVPPRQRLRITYGPQLRDSTFHVTVTQALAERLPIPGGYYGAGAIYNCHSNTKNSGGRFVGMVRYEGDTLQICYSSRDDTPYPRSLDEVNGLVKEFTIDKPVPGWFFQTLDQLHKAEASVSVSNIHLPRLSYIRYHRARNLPNNWVAIGDSVMKVNPAYGQGCSKAIIGAVTLNTALLTADLEDSQGSLPVNFSSLFFEAQAAKIDPIWEGTKTIDYGYDSTIPATGETLSVGRFLRWYSRRLNMVSITDQEAGLLVWRSLQLLSPAITSFQPGIVLKVLWDVLKHPNA